MDTDTGTQSLLQDETCKVVATTVENPANSLFLRFGLGPCLEDIDNTVERLSSGVEKSVAERLVLSKFRESLISASLPSGCYSQLCFLTLAWWQKDALAKTQAVVAHVHAKGLSFDDAKYAYVHSLHNPTDVATNVAYKMKQIELMLTAVVLVMKTRTDAHKQKGRPPKEAFELAVILSHAPPPWVIGKSKLTAEEREKLLIEFEQLGKGPHMIHSDWFLPVVPLLWLPHLTIGKNTEKSYGDYYDKAVEAVSPCNTMLVIELDGAFAKWLSDVTIVQGKIIAFFMTMIVFLFQHTNILSSRD